MKWAFLALAALFPFGDATHEPIPAPTRWQQPAERLPRPDAAGVCPGAFEAWTYDREHGAICVRRA